MLRNLQILPEIPKVPDGSGMKHFATSYEVSRSPYFETTANTTRDEASIIVSNIKDNVNLTSFYVDVPNLTEDDEIYARYKLHYKISRDGTTREADLGWSTIVNLKGDQEGFRVSDVIVGTPKLFVTKNLDKNLKGNIVVESSKMELFIGYGDHTATTWEVTDTDGGQIFYRKRCTDKDLLTKIELPYELFQPDQAYIIKAIYHTSTNADSLPGKYLYNDALFIKEYYTVIPETDLIVGRNMLFTVLLNVAKFQYIELILKNDQDIIVASSGPQETLYPSLPIPGDLKVGKSYRLYGRIRLDNEFITEYKYIKSFIAKPNQEIIIDPNAEYDDVNSFIFTQNIPLPTNMHYYGSELPTGGFVLPISSDVYPDDPKLKDQLAFYKLDGGILTYINEIPYTKPEELSIATSTVNLGGRITGIVPLFNGNVLVNREVLYEEASGVPGSTPGVDAINKESRTVFTLYKFISPTSSFKQLALKEFKNVFGSMGVSGSAVPLSNNDVLYIPAVEKNTNNIETKKEKNLSLYRLHIEDNYDITITKESELPFSVNRYVNMVTIDKDVVMVLGGGMTPTSPLLNEWKRSNNDIYIYKATTKQWSKVGTLPDSISKDIYNFHAVTRRDGNVVLFNNVETAGLAEDQSTVLIKIDRSNDLYNVTEVIKNNNDYRDGRIYTKTLVCNNGNVIRISSSPVEPQAVYTYKTKNFYNNAFDTEKIQDHVITDLVVAPNKTVIIDNPYRYTSITIQGDTKTNTSGKLVWVSSNNVREFDSDTLIVTRSMALDQDALNNLINSKAWKNILALDGVNITNLGTPTP